MFADRSAITLRELARHRFFMSGGGCEIHIHRIFSDAGIAIPDHLAVKQLPTIQAMVAEGLGVSVVPSLSVRNPHRGSRALRLKPRSFRKIGMLRPPGFAATPALQAWSDLIKTYPRAL
jgi:DNA-binding transcriptional LysR family regulator